MPSGAPKCFALSSGNMQKQTNNAQTLPTELNQMTNAFLVTSLGITSIPTESKDKQKAKAIIFREDC